MVVLRVELLEQLLSEIRRLAQKLRALADRERGNPRAREREVVRAVVVPLLGVRLGLDLEAHPPRRLLDQRPERGSLRARNLDIPRPPLRLERVEVQRQRRLVRRYHGMRRVVFRSPQPGLLRGHREENRRAPRLLFQSRPGPRNLEQDGAARRIIHRAVIDRVAVHWSADPQVVPVRAEHHRLRAPRRIAPRDLGHHVARLLLAHLGDHLPVKPYAQRNGVKPARLGSLQQFGHRVAR